MSSNCVSLHSRNEQAHCCVKTKVPRKTAFYITQKRELREKEERKKTERKKPEKRGF